jgi:hypothetical protein
MNFLLGSEFLRNFSFFRVAWIEGRLGGGKTLLSVAIADWLKRSGRVDQVWANFPLDIGSRADGVPENTCFIIDESWAFASRMRDAIKYAAHLRHRNCYLLLPSVFPPHNLLKRFRVRREYNFAMFGLPIWLYRWECKDYQLSGRFLLRFRSYFGRYDTLYEPSSDWGISEVLSASVRLDGVEGVEDFVEFSEAVSEFSDAVKGSVGGRKKRR